MGRKLIIELQGIRCVAIVAVFLFHIWPEIFCNGFLGVDIFFVVSGYIMAMILLSTDSLKESFMSTSLNFYYRRIYRILPLYLLNILTTMILVPAFSFTYYYTDLLAQVKTALTFTVNFEMMFTKNNYFTPGLTYNWFKHYWSLCVEMQFYAIVPFIFYASKKMPLWVNLFLVWPLLIGGCVGLIFYCIINYGEAGAFFTFTMLPARIYEFAGGFVAFHGQQFLDLYSDKSCILLNMKIILQNWITVNLLTIILLALSLFPIKLTDIYSLPAIVVVTSALIMAFGKEDNKEKSTTNSILANPVAVFIGNASYSLYISHWMIVFLSQLIYSNDEIHRQLTLITCVIVGISVHLLIEKPIVEARLKPLQFLPWLIMAYLAIFYVSRANEFSRKTSNFTKDLYHNQSKKIINESEWDRITASIHQDTSAEMGYYMWQELGNSNGIDMTKKGTGNISVLLIGNSHAGCIIPALETSLNGISSTFKDFAVGGQTPFEGFPNAKLIPEMKQVVRESQADVIFLVFKYMDDMDEVVDPALDALRIQAMQEMMDFLSNHTKALFVTQMHFEVLGFSSLKWAEHVWHNGWTGDYAVKRETIEASHEVSTRRWKQIKCEKCIFINMLDAFCTKDGICSPLDKSRKVPLIFDRNHFTKFGAYMLGPHLQKYFPQMYKLLE